MNQLPKIIFLDLEGTIFQTEHRLDNGVVAPSTWTVIADRLGECCLAEEEATKELWNSGKYNGYVEWMRDTIRIHQKYGLNRHIFEEVINEVRFMPGVHETIKQLRQQGVITAIVSGGFKALADRAQRSLSVDHALSACEYFFDDRTGAIEHFNLLPSDEQGKVDFVQLIAKEHGVKLEDCAFIGDGKNDVKVARAVGFSIAFNAQSELRKVASVVIDQFTGEEDFTDVLKKLRSHFTGLQSKPVGDQIRGEEIPFNVVQQLLDVAKSAREHAYCCYSHIAVGAAVMTEEGEIFSGCNVENASYGGTMCAERVAIFKAISAGHTSIRAVAVVADGPQPLPPCGICRQVIGEFGSEAKVFMANTKGDTKSMSMKELLPCRIDFGLLNSFVS